LFKQTKLLESLSDLFIVKQSRVSLSLQIKVINLHLRGTFFMCFQFLSLDGNLLPQTSAFTFAFFSTHALTAHIACIAQSHFDMVQFQSFSTASQIALKFVDLLTQLSDLLRVGVSVDHWLVLDVLGPVSVLQRIQNFFEV